MSHLSENTQRLQLRNSVPFEINTEPNVECLMLPYYQNLESIPNRIEVYKQLNLFISETAHDSTIIIITSPIFAADYSTTLIAEAHIKLWVAVKLEEQFKISKYINQHHAAMLVITKSEKSLQHTKTRIGYSYCPICDKTTKDYGGKKHLYHEYGTLMSDVWKDITVSFESMPNDILNRLQDLFGLRHYSFVDFHDLRILYASLNANHQYKRVAKKTNKFSYKGRTGSMLINDDCLEALRNIPENSIDFSFVDPPYNLEKKYESWDDGLDIQKYFEWCDEWLNGIARVLKPGGTVAVLNIPQWCVRHFKHLITILDFQDWIVWEGLSLPVRMIMPSHYTILCFSKGKPRPLPGVTRKNHSSIENAALLTLKEYYCVRGSCIKKRHRMGLMDREFATNLWWDIHRLKHNSRRVDHPCQLPPNFMYRLISLFTNEGEIVLDLFNGAGTTSLTAAQMKRNYVGIELSEYYHSIAEKRHNEFNEGIDPFRKADNTPKSKNSRVARLKKQKYLVPKKVLQLEIKDISKYIGRIPTREDVIKHSKHPIEYFDNYFIDWGEVTAAARTTGMKEDKSNKYDNTNQLGLWSSGEFYGDKDTSKQRQKI